MTGAPMTSAKYHKVYNRARPSIDPAEPSRKGSCFGKRAHRRRARGSRKFEAAGPRESQRLRTALAGRSDAAARDSTGHQNVIGNDRQPSRDVPIVWTASGGEPRQQPEVSQRDPSSDVVRDRPSILPRGRRFKSCPRYQKTTRENLGASTVRGFAFHPQGHGVRRTGRAQTSPNHLRASSRS